MGSRQSYEFSNDGWQDSQPTFRRIRPPSRPQQRHLRPSRPANRCRLCFRLHAPSSKLQAPSPKLQAPSSKLQASSFKLQASSFTYVYASYIDEPITRVGTGGLRYYHRNQQYSITALTDSSGNVTERYAYTAYGTPTITDGAGATLTTGVDNNRYTYTGRERDETLSLYHFRARMYDAVSGRFCSKDPVGYRDGYSLYRSYFVPSDVDPSGNHLLPVTSSGCFDYCRAQGGTSEYCLSLCGSLPVTSGSHPDLVYWGEEVDRWNPNDGKRTFEFPEKNDPADACQCKDPRFLPGVKLGVKGTISLVRPTVDGEVSGVGVTWIACEEGERVILRYQAECHDNQEGCKCEKKGCSIYTTWRCYKRTAPKRPKKPGIRPWEQETFWKVDPDLGHYRSKCK